MARRPIPRVRSWWVLLLLVVVAAAPPPVESSGGMVVSAQRLATEAGVAMLRQGGNAVDAAVAVGYALAVVHPCCGNIGGGGFLTTHLADGRNVFIDFRETSPAAASAGMYLDAAGHPVRGASLYGWKAAGVPGTVMGLDTALTRYGRLKRATVMAPAIRLAADGYRLDSADADILAHGAARLRRDPVAAAIFLHPDGSPLAAGDILRQPDLADTLRAIAEHGTGAFYAGAIPAAVEAASRAGGGLLTAADFAAYRAPETAPVSCSYRGNLVLSAPPPSSGGTTLCEMLNILEGYDLRALGFHGAESVHLMAEAMRLAFFDRNTSLGDPAFVDNPLRRLLSKDYATRLRGMIGDRAMRSSALSGGLVAPEKPETTHFSVIDRAGNAVSVTYTLNGGFGAGVMAPSTGFLMNDEMDDFTIKPNTPNQFGLVQGEANAIAPGKRPLSSMTPTIVLRDGAVRMVVGSPGGPRIITAVLEAILNVVDYGMNAQQAVDAPRLHLQWLPDVLFAEPFALSPDTEDLLSRMGYRIEVQPPWGAVELITVGGSAEPQAGGAQGVGPADAVAPHVVSGRAFFGANDPRRPSGAAEGP